MRYTILVVVVFGLAAATAEAQDLQRWLVRVDVGFAEIHRPGRDGVYGALHLARIWRNDHIRVDWGIMKGSADGGFLGGDVGVEFRACWPVVASSLMWEWGWAPSPILTA